MEPPEPLVHYHGGWTHSAGQKVLLLVGREPFPLYRALEL